MDYDVKKLLTAMREANAKASNYSADDYTASTQYTAYDEVNHPSHYTHGTRETIDVIKDVTGDGFNAFLVGQVIKYISRYQYKGKPVEDLQKADCYLKRLISEMEDKQ